MSELTPALLPEVASACGTNAVEVAAALSRGLDTEISVSVGEGATFDSSTPPEGFHGAGLVVLISFGDVGAVAVLPNASKLLPPWVSTPDATGESKLSTLAQELSLLLFPDSIVADSFAAAWVGNAALAIAAAEPTGDAALLPLTVTGEDRTGQLSLIWPVHAPQRLFAAETSDALPNKPASAHPAIDPDDDLIGDHPPSDSTARPSIPRDRATGSPRTFDDLPAYGRHLLKIEVPVIVQLVSKKQTIEEIMELGPGAILTFDKSCDDPLEMLVGNRRVALGSAVKVGEKFGLEITEITLPDERFDTVRPQRAS